MPDYYRLLEVHVEASPEVIERAYKALSLKYHPDKNPDRQEWATSRMAELNEAYAVLSNPHRRAMYDLKNPMGFAEKVSNFASSPEGKDLIRVFWARGLLGVAQAYLEEGTGDHRPGGRR